MDKHSTLILVLVAAAFILSPSVFADEPTPDAAWLDSYLAAELGYGQEEIDQFKANVANLSRAELTQLVDRLKHARLQPAARQQQRLIAHQRNLDRLQTAEAAARARPSRVAPRYVDGSYLDGRPRDRDYGVHRTGLFRGYYGWIRVP